MMSIPAMSGSAPFDVQTESNRPERSHFGRTGTASTIFLLGEAVPRIGESPKLSDSDWSSDADI
jgi:hypothetical protein